MGEKTKYGGDCGTNKTDTHTHIVCAIQISKGTHTRTYDSRDTHTHTKSTKPHTKEAKKGEV